MGHDPMEELRGLLSEPAPAGRPDRRIAVPPPPTDDITVPVPRAVQDSASAADAAADAPAAEPPPEAVSAPAVLPAPSRSGRSRVVGGGALGGRAEPQKAISGGVPQLILDDLRQLRLDRDVDGRPLVVGPALSEALLALPSEPRRLAALFDRYRAQLNVGRRSSDEGWLPEGKFSSRISASSYRHVMVLLRALHGEFGSTVAREDVYGLALLQLLATARR